MKRKFLDSTTHRHTWIRLSTSQDGSIPGHKLGFEGFMDHAFDYFSFQAAASTAIGFESVTSRGLLLGTDYDIDKNYRGLWGLYGNYSYLAPRIFRFASTGLSLGTTGEWRLSNSLARHHRRRILCQRCIRGPGPSRQRNTRGCVAHVAHSSPACSLGQISAVTT
jgi:hypothetical protein